MTKEAGLPITKKSCGHSARATNHGTMVPTLMLVLLICNVVVMLLLWNHTNGFIAWERKGGRHTWWTPSPVQLCQLLSSQRTPWADKQHVPMDQSANNSPSLCKRFSGWFQTKKEGASLVLVHIGAGPLTVQQTNECLGNQKKSVYPLATSSGRMPLLAPVHPFLSFSGCSHEWTFHFRSQETS